MTIDEALNRMIYLEEEALKGGLQIHTPLEQPRLLSNADIEAIGVAIDRLKAKSTTQRRWKPNFRYGISKEEKFWICPDCRAQTMEYGKYCPNCGECMEVDDGK